MFYSGAAFSPGSSRRKDTRSLSSLSSSRQKRTDKRRSERRRCDWIIDNAIWYLPPSSASPKFLSFLPSASLSLNFLESLPLSFGRAGAAAVPLQFRRFLLRSAARAKNKRAVALQDLQHPGEHDWLPFMFDLHGPCKMLAVVHRKIISLIIWTSKYNAI